MDEQRSTGIGPEGGEPDPLAKAVAELPRSLQPSSDLWPEIEAQLEPRSRFGRPSRPRVWQQALAALLFMALGAVVTFVAMSRGQAAAVLSSAADAEWADSGAVDTEYAAAAWADDVLPSRELELIEVEYLRAKEALWLEVFSQRDRLEPGTWEVVERNLGAIDQAIRQLRQAMAVEPDNRRLGAKLLDTHKLELDLLRRLTDQV